MVEELSLRSVSLSVDSGGRCVVDGIDLTLPSARCLAVVGESGAGKTSLALAVMGLWRGSVSGRIMFGQTELTTLGARQYRRLRGDRLVFLSQDPVASLNPGLTVGWQLREILRIKRRLSRSAAKAESLAWFEKVGLGPAAEISRTHVHQLSGGMAQRVALAMALACRPDILVADEPFSALDRITAASQIELLEEWWNRLGFSLLLITHDPTLARRLADTVTVIRQGRLVEDGPADVLFSTPKSNYTASLLTVPA